MFDLSYLILLTFFLITELFFPLTYVLITNVIPIRKKLIKEKVLKNDTPLILVRYPIYILLIILCVLLLCIFIKDFTILIYYLILIVLFCFLHYLGYKKQKKTEEENKELVISLYKKYLGDKFDKYCISSLNNNIYYLKQIKSGYTLITYVFVILCLVASVLAFAFANEINDNLLIPIIVIIVGIAMLFKNKSTILLYKDKIVINNFDSKYEIEYKKIKEMIILEKFGSYKCSIYSTDNDEMKIEGYLFLKQIKNMLNVIKLDKNKIKVYKSKTL